MLELRYLHGRSAMRSAAYGDIVVPNHRTASDWSMRFFDVASSSSDPLRINVKDEL